MPLELPCALIYGFEMPNMSKPVDDDNDTGWNGAADEFGDDDEDDDDDDDDDDDGDDDDDDDDDDHVVW